MAKNSRLILSKAILVDRDYKNVMNLTDDEMVATLRSSLHLLAERANYSFIRPYQNVIQSDIPYGLCEQANYLGFQNPDYGGKWFFAWIDQIKYIAENCTEIMYTIDYWETWFSWAVPRQCYVLREHTNDDTRGNNLLPEPVSMFNQYQYGHYQVSFQYYFAIALRVVYSNVFDIQTTSYNHLDGVPQVGYTAFIPLFTDDKAGLEDMENRIEKVVSNWRQIIQGLKTVNAYFVKYPVTLVREDLRTDAFGTGLKIYSISTSAPHSSLVRYPYNPDSLAVFHGVQPTATSNYIKNQKTLTHQFVQCVVGDNHGRNTDFAFEGWQGSGYATPAFTEYDSLQMGGESVIVPIHYFGVDENFNYAFDASKMPLADTESQPFYEWLKTALPTAFVSIAAAAGHAETALIAERRAGATLAGHNTLLNREAHEAAQRRLSRATDALDNQVKESAVGAVSALTNSRQATMSSPSILTGLRKDHFTIWMSAPNYDELHSIDAFFTKYGYATNQIKTPNWNGREHFNYVQIGANDVVGYSSAPSVAMDVINSAARAGVTVWHGNDYIGDYSVSNNIVSEG